MAWIVVLLLPLLTFGARGAVAHGLPDQAWDACTNFSYATDPCDCDTGDPQLCCMGQEFTPRASEFTGVDLYLRGGPDVDPNQAFSTFVTVNLRMGTVKGPLMGSATAPLILEKAFMSAWVHFDFPSPLLLAPGLIYVLEVRAAPERVMWWGSSESSCGSGYSAGSQLTLSEPGCCDFNFRTYGGMVAGGGPRATDCTHEWLTSPPPPLDARGVPQRRLACTDDDPSCDFGSSGDQRCTLHVAECFNVADPLLTCRPSDVAAVKLLGDGNATDAGNRQALEAALIAKGGKRQGHCKNVGPHRGEVCALDSDCDSQPGTSDGACKGRLIGFTPPLSASAVCTEFAEVTVPLRQQSGILASGRKALRIKATPSGQRSDSDVLTLICQPKP